MGKENENHMEELLQALGASVRKLKSVDDQTASTSLEKAQIGHLVLELKYPNLVKELGAIKPTERTWAAKSYRDFYGDAYSDALERAMAELELAEGQADKEIGEKLLELYKKALESKTNIIRSGKHKDFEGNEEKKKLMNDSFNQVLKKYKIKLARTKPRGDSILNAKSLEEKLRMALEKAEPKLEETIINQEINQLLKQLKDLQGTNDASLLENEVIQELALSPDAKLYCHRLSTFYLRLKDNCKSRTVLKNTIKLAKAYFTYRLSEQAAEENFLEEVFSQTLKLEDSRENLLWQDWYDYLLEHGYQQPVKPRKVNDWAPIYRDFLLDISQDSKVTNAKQLATKLKEIENELAIFRDEINKSNFNSELQ